jgi:ATP-dependent DNA helicase DinG
VIEYEKSFPFENIREQQAEAIEFCLDKITSENKRFCIIEAGTGVGKSAIGLTLARVIADRYHSSEDFLSGGYFLTTQKILQQQYVDDFPSVVSLKSSSNYKCRYHKANTCAESQKMLKTADKSSRFFKTCTFGCRYKEKKERFLESAESVSNFSYFLTEANYSGKITPRQTLVIDEGHNVETELSKFVEITVSEHFASSILKIKFPTKLTQHQTYIWIRDTYLPTAKRRLKYFEDTIEKFGGDKMREKLKQFQTITKQYDLLRGHIGKIKKFVEIYNSDNWVFDTSKTEKRGYRKAAFKPIDISVYAEDYLFRLGERVIIMSATIMDPKIFMKTLGLSEDETCFISLPSPFPKENRPVIFSPVGSMSARAIDYTLPKLAEAVKAILEHHKGEKGIIHCKTYKIANYLKNNIKSSRILTHDSTNRDAILEKHTRSKKNTVLLSPSMTEGVDLADDVSRFQIICKVPYPYLGDKLVRKRMNKFKGWYELQTAKSIVQSIGRSVRSDVDHAVTYILDGDFDRFLNRNSNVFSKDFKECLLK